jgi:hypothetical protein
MAESSPVRISTVIMHHPSRAALLPRLLEGLRLLAPRVVVDPDPEGSPSPLRTAKLAWAAIDPGATHHAVFQDDINPAPDIARLLRDAVNARPEDGISLYVNWNSPQNSYLVRRAAVSGAPFAQLSPQEYTPTLGLVLPAARAAELASHLAGLPDHLRDDDEMVTPFCRRAGLTVVGAVPHLLDHGGDRSLAGNDGHGVRRGTVFAPGAALGPAHWSDGPTPPHATDPGPVLGSEPGYAVELADSTCRIRFVRPVSTEPVEHPFGWYWYDWCALVGADRDRIVATWRAIAPGTMPFDLGLEFWAGCYLLGADAAGHAGALPAHRGVVGDLARRALGSWIDSGLTPDDRRLLGTATRTRLTALGLLAVAQGARDRLQSTAPWAFEETGSLEELLHA